MGILIITLYIIRLIISWFILRYVYLKRPYMLDGGLTLTMFIPFIGVIISLLYLAECCDQYLENKKEKILNFIFRIKN